MRYLTLLLALLLSGCAGLGVHVDPNWDGGSEPMVR